LTQEFPGWTHCFPACHVKVFRTSKYLFRINFDFFYRWNGIGLRQNPDKNAMKWPKKKLSAQKILDQAFWGVVGDCLHWYTLSAPSNSFLIFDELLL
jgi:hypothetical protein